MRPVSKKKTYNKYAEPDRFNNMAGVDKAAGITLLLMAAIIPLIVRYVEAPVGPDLNQYITASQTAPDLFSYYKSILLLTGSGVLLICLFAYTFSERLKSIYHWRELYTSPLSVGFIIFLLTIIVSSIHSPFPYTVVHGIKERFESVFVLLGYLVIFASAVLFVRGAYQCRLLLYGLLFSCFFIGLIGMFQFFKMDFFMTAFASKLVIGLNTTLRLTTPFPDLSYTTLYNPNSVGAYTALMLPLTVVGAVYYNPGARMRAAFIACAVVTLFTAIGCNSAGGLLGLFVAAFVLIIIFIRLDTLKHNRLRKRIVFGVLGIIACAAAVIFLVGPVRSRVYSMVEKIVGGMTTSVNGGSMQMNIFNPGSASSSLFFKDMSVSGDTADIATANGDITFTRKPEGVSVSIGGAAPVQPVSSKENSPDNNPQNKSVVSSYSVTGFGDFTVQEQSGWFGFIMNNVVFIFGVDQNNNLTVLSKMMRPIDLSKQYPSAGPASIDTWGSGRGYIWAHTLPLLSGEWLGSGPDTYILVFPQDDILGKLRTFGDPYIVVDKAHNLFLQTGVNTGIISMLALLFIFGWYIIKNFLSIAKGAARNEEKWMFGMRIAILAGVCGYAVASMTTDSTVSVAPVFWLTLGIGAALQRRLTRRE